MMMNRPLVRRHRSQQRGAAALAVALILLFGVTIVAFFANRGFIFEQRTSANQYRSTRAFEMAEAGLEWAVSRLNDDRIMAAQPSCATTGGATSFPDRYLPITAAGFTYDATRRAACSIAANGATTCQCATAGTDPTAIGAADLPRFLIEFRDPGVPYAVEIVSWGCTGAGLPCTPGSATRPDATAVVRALYMMKPAFPNAPGAGLVTGLSAVTGGNIHVINLDPKSNGITINSGTSVELGTGTNVSTLPGTPDRASILDNDPSLNDLTTADANGDAFFSTFFGETQADYQANEKTWLITDSSANCPTGAQRCTVCGTANACGSAISAAYDAGFQRFWTDTDATFQNNLPAVGTLGTAQKPITIASSASVELKGAMVAYGILYAATLTASEDWNYSGSGNGKIFGAMVSRGSFNKGGTGTLDLIYDPNIFAPQNSRGTMVRVPGSWRDSLNEL
jgi:Tfp pilus assembly protein PilX